MQVYHVHSKYRFWFCVEKILINLFMQMGRVGEKLGIDFVISTGDNFYENGLEGVHDQEFEESFTDIYTAQSLQKPWYLGE